MAPTVRVSSTTFPPLPAEVSDSDADPGAKAGDPPHIYRPLRPDDIRLLILNPGTDDEPIECYLEQWSLSKVKPFLALSYVWGSPEDPATIHLNGHPVSVTRNLGAFLSAYRGEHEPTVLWIDALCINQADVEERQAQIRLMKRVYEGAETIIIWLGEAIAGTERAFDRIDKVYSDYWLSGLLCEQPARKPPTSLTAEEALAILGVPPGISDLDVESREEWDGLIDIFERQWWTRIWVYQEATAPALEGSLVVCGPHFVGFELVLVVHRVIRRLVTLLSGGISTLQPHKRYPQIPSLTDRAIRTPDLMHTYLSFRRDYLQRGTSRFLRMADLLPAMRGFDATDPRDKLYALIPTSLDGAELLDPAYETPVEQVYADAAWAFIREHGNLDILGHCFPPHRDGSSTLDLPSWVPDWTAKGTPTPFFKRGFLKQHEDEPEEDSGDDRSSTDSSRIEVGKLYRAAGDAAAQARRDTSGRILTCTGFIVDRIQHVSPGVGKSPNSSVDVAQPWATWLDEVVVNRSLRSRMVEALPHVLVADCYRDDIDIGTRGCKAHPFASSGGQGVTALPEEVIGRNGDGTDFKGPHPSTFRRRLMLTEKGSLGLTAEHAESGDAIAILLGGQLPCVLREVGAHYIFIGEAYVHGIMGGEALGELGRAVELEIW